MVGKFVFEGSCGCLHRATRSSAQHPSPRTKPSARRSNVWHRPLIDVMPAMAMLTEVDWSNIMLTPAATCISQFSWMTPDSAEPHATSDAEHAVSIEMHGPCSPSAYETRP